MKCVLRSYVVFAIVVGLFGCSQEKADQAASPTESAGPAASATKLVSARTVEAGCGSCIYEMPGVEGCQLAVKIDGQPYLVTGTTVDAHGAGLCSAAKNAKVTGTIEDETFAATKFEILEQ